MTKIIIEDGFSTCHKTGIGQYTLMLEKLIEQADLEMDEINKNYLINIKNRFIRRILYNIWLNSIFLLNLFFMKEDIICLFTNFAVPTFKHKNVKYISVIHDLCAFKFPECSSKLINRYEKNNIINAIKNADSIITVSNTIKNEIINLFNYDKNRIFVVNSSLTTGLLEIKPANTNEVFDKYKIQSKKYILSVATNNKRKNISLLVNAYRKLQTKHPEIKLVLVGSNYKQEENNSNIVITGYISDSELRVLYKEALLYVFPSIYEGFGTPLIDAQSFEIPVICNNIPVFKEIAEDSAIFFDNSEDDLITKIIEAIQNNELRESYIQKGYKNIEKYTYDRIYKQLEAVINYGN